MEAGHGPLDGGLAQLPGEAPCDVRVLDHKGGRQVLRFGLHFGMNVTWSSGKRKARSGDGERERGPRRQVRPVGFGRPPRERRVRRSPRQPVRRQAQPCTFVPRASAPLGATLRVLLWGWKTEKEFCDLAGRGHLENRRDCSETGEYSRYYKSRRKLLEGAQGSAPENSCPRFRRGLGS